MTNHRDVESMSEYISKNCDILKPGKLSNISTGYEISEETNCFLLQCFQTGEAGYEAYRKDRLDDKSVALFESICDPHKKKENKTSENAGKPD